jgi:hypothetical protein
MKFIKEYNKLIRENSCNQLIVESSLSRLWSFVQKNKPFAMVSWQRGAMNEEKNAGEIKKKAFSELKKEVRKLGYGYIELLGGYTEQGDEPTDVVDELSLCIPNITLDEALYLGQKDLGFGSQDVVLYSDGKQIAFHNTNSNHGKIGEVSLRFKYGKDKEALPMSKDAVKEYFSKLRKGSHSGKKFAFEADIPKSSSETTIPEGYTFKLLELRDRKTPRNKNHGWWGNFGMRIL